MLLHTVTYSHDGGPERTAAIRRRRRLTYAGCARVLAKLFCWRPRSVAVIRVDVAADTR